MPQITFLFPTQIYYKMNFITLPSILPHDFRGTLTLIIADCFWRTFFAVHKKCIFLNISVKLVLEDFFCGTQKMHFSEYICKTERIRNFVKMQGNL